MAFQYRTDEGVAEIRFDDGKANVMSTAWFRELGGLLDRAEKDEARGVLFRGRAGMFSGGLDMKWLPTLRGDDARELVETFSSTMLRVWSLPIPTTSSSATSRAGRRRVPRLDSRKGRLPHFADAWWPFTACTAWTRIRSPSSWRSSLSGSSHTPRAFRSHSSITDSYSATR